MMSYTVVPNTLSVCYAVCYDEPARLCMHLEGGNMTIQARQIGFRILMSLALLAAFVGLLVLVQIALHALALGGLFGVAPTLAGHCPGGGGPCP